MLGSRNEVVHCDQSFSERGVEMLSTRTLGQRVLPAVLAAALLIGLLPAMAAAQASGENESCQQGMAANCLTGLPGTGQGPAPAPSGVAAAQNRPLVLPRTGDAPVGAPWTLAIAGLGLLVAGVSLRVRAPGAVGVPRAGHRAPAKRISTAA